MKRMTATFFKGHCLAVLDGVRARRETVIITKRGKPLAKLVPVNRGADDIFGFMAGKGAIVDDIVSPAISDEDWGQLKLP